MSNTFTLLYCGRDTASYYIFDVLNLADEVCGTVHINPAFVSHFISKVWGGKLDWNEPQFFGGDV